jgi:hypothetical protein
VPGPHIGPYRRSGASYYHAGATTAWRRCTETAFPGRPLLAAEPLTYDVVFRLFP